MEYTPLKLLAVDGTVTDLHLIRKNALIRQPQHGSFLGPEIVAVIQIMDEHQIGDLLNNIQRVHQSARRKNIPEAVDFVFQFTCNHYSLSLFQV